MDLKKIIKMAAKDKLLGGAANKILPMEGNAPKFSKGKLAAVLTIVAAIAAALPELLK